jgi:hypothetical protein
MLGDPYKGYKVSDGTDTWVDREERKQDPICTSSFCMKRSKSHFCKDFRKMEEDNRRHEKGL